MKKSIKNLLSAFKENVDGSLTGGFAAIRGGYGLQSVSANTQICTNNGNCSGSNTDPMGCSNTGDCTKANNSGYCTDSGKCA